MDRFPGKVAIVTGAASGIGKATVQHFAAEGAKVVVADIHSTAANEVADAINRSGGKAIAVACDISQDASVQSLVSSTIQAFGRVDILVNSAARFLMRGGKEAREEDWREVFGTNVGGTALCSRYAAGGAATTFRARFAHSITSAG